MALVPPSNKIKIFETWLRLLSTFYSLFELIKTKNQNKPPNLIKLNAQTNAYDEWMHAYAIFENWDVTCKFLLQTRTAKLGIHAHD